MYLLYSFIFLMLISSVILLATPFIYTHSIYSKTFILSSLFVIVFSLGLYQFSNDHAPLKQWLTQGEKHYQLQEEVIELGGFSGMITLLKKKLAANPEDAKGWFILGKLYFADQDYLEAKEALGKASSLRPNDQEIKRFYNRAIEKDEFSKKNHPN